MYDDFQYNASNGLIKAYWSQNYAVIYQCNDVIETIEKGNLTEENDLRNKGEALFFRAYCYFNLVRAFGEVPLVTFKVNDASEANVPKTTAEEIYKQIDSDLTQAEGLLPRQWQSAYLGRLTWGSARALHARTYMMRNDWQNMYTAATDVMNSGQYNLNTLMMSSSPMKARTAVSRYSSCNAHLLPLCPQAIKSAASSAKYKVYAVPANGTSAGDGTWVPS
ncbi:SusD family [Bacteroides fragilis NCTC 9343]|nr:SusD family [Bacteroides fragilis NCTC 9343]